MNSNEIYKMIWLLSTANMSAINEMLTFAEKAFGENTSIQKFSDAYYNFMKATNVFYSENIFKEA